MLLCACATTGSTGKGSSAPFQGTAVIAKRRNEIHDAGKAVMDCLKTKVGDPTIKYGVFAVTADASGKLTAETLAWDGPEPPKACVIATAAKTTVTPLPGPPISGLWEFGTAPAPVVPSDLSVKVQSLQQTAQSAVDACGQQNLPPEFPADIAVEFLVDPAGTVHGATVVQSTSKDGGFDNCVRNVVVNTKFPQENVTQPYPVTLRFHVGRLEKL